MPRLWEDEGGKQFSVFAAHGTGHSPASAALPAAAVVAGAVAVAVTEGATLAEFGELVAGCTRCALAQTRTQVVFGSGHSDC